MKLEIELSEEGYSKLCEVREMLQQDLRKGLSKDKTIEIVILWTWRRYKYPKNEW